MAAPKAGTSTSTRHRIQQSEQPKGRTTGEQPGVARVVTIDFFGKQYTKNKTIFEIKYLIMGDHTIYKYAARNVVFNCLLVAANNAIFLANF